MATNHSDDLFRYQENQRTHLKSGLSIEIVSQNVTINKTTTFTDIALLLELYSRRENIRIKIQCLKGIFRYQFFS